MLEGIIQYYLERGDLNPRDETLVFRYQSDSNYWAPFEDRFRSQKEMMAIPIDFQKTPISRLGKLAEIWGELQERLFVACFCWNWQLIEGNKFCRPGCG